MEFAQLAKRLLKKDQPLSLGEWPDQISPPLKSSGGFIFQKNEFWENVEKLRMYTDRGSENFSTEYEGSTGWEYEMMVVYVEGTFYYSLPGTTREYEHVRSKHSLKVATEFDKKTITVFDRIMLDGRKVGMIVYKGKDEIERRNRRFEENEVEIGFVIHFHSHPQLKIKKLEKPVFAFFSRQDMFSLFHGSTQMVGLVSDRVWLVGKSNVSTLPEHNELQEVSIAEAVAPEQFEQAASDLMSRHQLALYVANFGGRFKRLA